MWKSFSIALLSASCACPPAPCPASIKIELSSTAWPAGAWEVRVTGDKLDAACTVSVEATGEAPAIQDVRCGDAGLRAGAVFDTGWASSLGPLIMTAAARSAGDLTLHVTHTAGEQVTRWTWTEAPAWRDLRPPSGTCFVGCKTGALALTLPPARPAD